MHDLRGAKGVIAFSSCHEAVGGVQLGPLRVCDCVVTGSLSLVANISTVLVGVTTSYQPRAILTLY